MNRISFLILALQVAVILSSELPVQKCRLEDSDCLRNSAQAFLPLFTLGLSDIDVEPLDPMHIDEIRFNLAGLDMDIKNINSFGLKETTIEKLSVDMATKKIDLIYTHDALLKGDYKASGKLLSLPIYGDGDIEINIENLKINLVMPFEIKKNENGKDTINLKSSSFTYKVLGRLKFNLTNLFDGNKQLSDVMINTINQNWREVADLFGTTVLEKPVAIVAKAIKKCLRSQSIEDIAIL